MHLYQQFHANLGTLFGEASHDIVSEYVPGMFAARFPRLRSAGRRWKCQCNLLIFAAPFPLLLDADLELRSPYRERLSIHPCYLYPSGVENQDYCHQKQHKPRLLILNSIRQLLRCSNPQNESDRFRLEERTMNILILRTYRVEQLDCNTSLYLRSCWYWFANVGIPSSRSDHRLMRVLYPSSSFRPISMSPPYAHEWDQISLPLDGTSSRNGEIGSSTGQFQTTRSHFDLKDSLERCHYRILVGREVSNLQYELLPSLVSLLT